MIIYDAEIIKAIADKKHPHQVGIEYCEGWRDFKGMGVSVVCAYDYNEERYRVFLKDNFSSLQALFDQHDLLVGFNNLRFDNPLLGASELLAPAFKSYDILREIWQAAGIGPEFRFPTHLGYGLDAVLRANLPGMAKSGDGAMAPIWWQQGEIGKVVDYCLEDVRLTKRLFDIIMDTGELQCPKAGKTLNIVTPHARLGLDGEPKEVPSAGDDPSLS